MNSLRRLEKELQLVAAEKLDVDPSRVSLTLEIKPEVKRVALPNNLELWEPTPGVEDLFK